LLADWAREEHIHTIQEVSPMQEARIELLQRMPIFGGIRADVLQGLLRLCPTVSVPTNEYFFRELDQADSMFVIEIGKVEVLKFWRGQEYLLKILEEGDCFGEMAVMDLSPRSASVRAVEDCTAIRVSAATLYKLYEQDPKQFALIQMNMGREVTRRLRQADDRLFERMGPGADISEFSWATRDTGGQPPRIRTERSDH
jgi:CRP/FNR family transcriptional regulator, cyclic AMP receptor protein